MMPPNIHFVNSPQWLEYRFGKHPFRQYQVASYDHQAVVYRPFKWGVLSGVSLLAVYGRDIESTMGRWLSAMWQDGVRYIHLLTSPHSAVRDALKQMAVTIQTPFCRTPYYLTAKPLVDEIDDRLFTFAHWDCMGGDIL